MICSMGDFRCNIESAELENESPFPLTETDKWVLSQTDEEFHLHDWEELKDIIGETPLLHQFDFDFVITYHALFLK